MRHWKMLAAAAAVLLAAGCGLYLSGYLALRLLGLPGATTVTWHLYPDYLRALQLPQVRPYASRIRLAGGLGFGAPCVLMAIVLAALLRSTPRSLHGDARFANGRDLRRHGLFHAAGEGIVLGRHGGKLLRLGGQQSVLLAAPTRSGKGVGVVVPNLLDYAESVVVLDIKQENFALTSGWRQRQGHAVFLFNPFAEDRRTHRWNPLTYVSPDPALRVSDLMGIAALLYPDGRPEQAFWTSHARNAFMAFALYLFDNRDDARRTAFPGMADAPTLGALYRLTTGDGGEAVRDRLERMCAQPFLQAGARTAFANLLALADVTFASVLGTFKEPLNPWLNPILDAATSGDDFLLTDLRKRRMSIYVGIQPNRLAEGRLILNLFFAQLINANTRELPKANPQLRHQCLLLMDEFTAIGKLDILASASAYMAGYNLRLLPVIQSLAQLDATYGKDVARTLLTNHALQIVFAPREQQDANDYSEMLGTTTVRRQHVTRGRETTRNETEERRALMLPQELKALGGERQVLLCEGLAHAVLCDKIRYHRDPYFTARLLPAVTIPALHG
ncbi:MAG TPA: type IV secretory system conjugative DNA transfer family protein [Luteimonas sp.]|nr:type IV secretory system conjugative DNA transfer family protein [Luteimonas sp.]